mmetsp:Transcript_137103/g.382342  ORF Transcript_137103/g.382342 Transcript_137103/m.382342 type:complete len:236 (-) Transcript_137103:402-1109(-)
MVLPQVLGQVGEHLRTGGASTPAPDVRGRTGAALEGRQPCMGPYRRAALVAGLRTLVAPEPGLRHRHGLAKGRAHAALAPQPSVVRAARAPAPLAAVVVRALGAQRGAVARSGRALPRRGLRRRLRFPGREAAWQRGDHQAGCSAVCQGPRDGAVGRPRHGEPGCSHSRCGFGCSGHGESADHVAAEQQQLAGQEPGYELLHGNQPITAVGDAAARSRAPGATERGASLHGHFQR